MADLTANPILSVGTTVESKLADIEVVDGQLLYVRDKQKIIFDFDGKRTVYSQIKELATDAARTSMLAPVTGLYYFVLETAVLWTYQDSWVQITTPPESIPSIEGLASETYVKEYAQPKGNYLTAVPDEYVTETELTAKGYLTSYIETDPTVPAWAKASTKPSYTATEVGADASGTANTLVSSHNTKTDAHNDIRLLIEGLTTRLNALADSDDTTLDQMSEIVAYIKSNKTLIEDVTTNKINVSDIVNNLTTNVTNKPLSAAQGVAIKALIDALETEIDGHTHAISDVSGLQSALDAKSPSSHNHDSVYYTQAQIDEALSQKTQVQIITWGADD